MVALIFIATVLSQLIEKVALLLLMNLTQCCIHSSLNTSDINVWHKG